jgi:Flp pilus assembly protein TadB
MTTLRNAEKNRNSSGGDRPYLTGWKLLIALIVVAAVALVTLWMTGSPEAAVVVVAPLMIIIGVDSVDRVREGNDRVRQGTFEGNRPYLTGWNLLIALIVVAAVALVTLWMTGSPEAAVVVVAPLLLIIGVERYRR